MKIKPYKKCREDAHLGKVFVGLSGGVDSAVSAALLKKEGYDVTGVFIKAWTPPFDSAQGTRKQICGWKEDRRSAMRVCAILDIPFITLDLEKEYKKEVVDYMIDEYKKGRTPNPDVMCNKEIKFGHFLKFALKNGAQYVATGHYAIRYENYPTSQCFKGHSAKATKSYENSKPLPSPPPLQGEGEGGEVVLAEGADKNKDQSYFLWTLTQNQLKHILFPIGHLQKSEVRKLAQKFGLPQATRKDSQGLCFLGKIDMKEFLAKYIPQKRGDVLLAPSSDQGEGVGGGVIGHHNGAIFFTIGERRGFTITKKTEKETPLYVVSKNIENNTITVASKTSPPAKVSAKFRVAETPLSLTRRGGQGGEVLLQEINIISEIPNKNLLCRIRYRQEKIPCKIEIAEKMPISAKVYFDKPQMGVSAGQSLVLYDGEICLGGGIIS